VAEEPARLNHEGWWRKPLLVSSPIDQRFDVLPKIAMDEHLHPQDLLKTVKLEVDSISAFDVLRYVIAQF